MKSRPRTSWPILSALAMTLLIAGAASAQGTTASQTSEVIKFEVISVDGNTLVVRDQTGAREMTVPDDFRFGARTHARNEGHGPGYDDHGSSPGLCNHDQARHRREAGP